MSNRPLDRDSLYGNFGTPMEEMIQDLRDIKKNGNSVDAQARADIKTASDKIGTLTTLPGWLQSSLSDAVNKLNEHVRQYGVNLKQPPYNCKADGSDETLVIQSAIDYAKANKLSVYAPAGTYGATKVVLKTGVTIKGAGEAVSTLKALKSSEVGFVKMEDAGPVSNISISDIRIEGLGTNNPNQNGFHFDAIEQDIPSYTGGLWWSVFSNITITNFDGCQIFLRAQDGRGDLANQFLTFTNVKAFKTSALNSRCLKVVGQLGQSVWVNCQFDGLSPSLQSTAGTTNVELSREFLADGVTPLNDVSPSVAKFITCTFQNADLAIVIDRGQGIIFDNCWFENLNKVCRIKNSAFGIVVQNSHFANAGSDGSGGGYGVKVENSSVASVINNHVTGAMDTFIIGSSHRGILHQGNQTDGSKELKTSGVVAQATPAATLNTYFHKQLILNNSSTVITSLNSMMPTNETITFRAFSASAAIQFSTGGNITLGGKTTLTLAQHQTATFIKSDLGATQYVLLFTSGTLV